MDARTNGSGLRMICAWISAGLDDCWQNRWVRVATCEGGRSRSGWGGTAELACDTFEQVAEDGASRCQGDWILTNIE